MKTLLEKIKVLNLKNLTYIWKKSQQDLIFVHASSLTYSTFLNFIPMFALAYYFFDFIGGFEQLQGDAQNFISDNLAPQFADEILTYLEIIRIKINPQAMGVFGVVGFIVSGIVLLSKIEVSLNSMWNFPKTRPWVQKVTTYWTMLSLGPIFIGFSIIAVRQALIHIQSDTGVFGYILASVMSVFPYLTTTLFFTAIYLWLPAIRIPWKAALLGGVVAAILFEGLKQLYAVYAVYALKNSIYGTLAVIPIFMVWMNFLWVVILFGAQVSHFYVQKPFAKK